MLGRTTNTTTFGLLSNTQMPISTLSVLAGMQTNLANIALNSNKHTTIDNITNNKTNTTTINMQQMFQEDDHHPLRTAMFVFGAILIIPGVIGNGLIIAAVSKLRILHHATNYLLCSLAVADLTMMLAMTGYLVCEALGVNYGLTHFVLASLDYVVAPVSIMSIAAVSFDRYLAVVRPLRYDQIFYRKRALYIIKGIWIYVAITFTLSILRIEIHNKAYTYTVLIVCYIVGFVVPCGIVVFSYAVIILTSLRVMTLSNNLNISLHSNLGKNTEKFRKNKRNVQLREAKVAANFMLILVPFLTGWGFYFGTLWADELSGRSEYLAPIYEWFLLMVPWVLSSLNPIVYILFTRKLRNGCKKLIRKYITQRNQGGDLGRSLTGSFSRRLFLSRRKSSIDSQSRSLLSLWNKSKRSSCVGETMMAKLDHSCAATSKEEEKRADNDNGKDTKKPVANGRHLPSIEAKTEQ